MPRGVAHLPGGATGEVHREREYKAVGKGEGARQERERERGLRDIFKMVTDAA